MLKREWDTIVDYHGLNLYTDFPNPRKALNENGKNTEKPLLWN